MGCISTRQTIVNNSIPKEAQTLIKEQVKKVLTQTQSKPTSKPSITIEANIQIGYSNLTIDNRKSSLKKGYTNIKSKNGSVVFIDVEKKQNPSMFNTKESKNNEKSLVKLIEPINKQLEAINNDKFILKEIDDETLFKILEFTVNLKELKKKFFQSSQSLNTDIPSFEDQLKECRNLLLINKRISSLILCYIKAIRESNFDKIKNKTIITTTLNINTKLGQDLSFVSNKSYGNIKRKSKRCNSLSPRTNMYTNRKLIEVKTYNNFNNIRDIADEDDHRIFRKISSFNSFGK